MENDCAFSLEQLLDSVFFGSHLTGTIEGRRKMCCVKMGKTCCEKMGEAEFGRERNVTHT